MHITEQADLTDIDLLRALLDETSARIDVVACQLLFELAYADAIGNEFIWVHANLIFASNSSEARDTDNAGDGLELLFKGPVLDRFERHIVVFGVRAPQ